MDLNFCIGAKWRIRRLVKSHKKADYLTKYFFFTLLTLYMLMGALCVPSEKQNFLKKGRRNIPSTSVSPTSLTFFGLGH